MTSREIVPPVEFFEPQVNQSPVELSRVVSGPTTPSNDQESDVDTDTADDDETAGSDANTGQSAGATDKASGSGAAPD